MRPNTRRPFVVSALVTVALLVGGVLGAAPAGAAAPPTMPDGTPAGTGTASTVATPSGTLGVDVSAYGGSIDWSRVPAGTQFAYIQDTIGSTSENSQFYQQWMGAAKAGLLRGAYHYAEMTESSGATQARYFYTHGGGYATADPETLPPVLDVEFDSNGACPNFAANSQIVAWIKDFVTTFTSLTGRAPVIYTSSGFWSSCTSNTTAFAGNPLWIADYDPAPPAVPSAWSKYTFWQYAPNTQSPTASPFDLDVFNGTLDQLKAFAAFPRIAGSDRYGTGVAASQSFDSGVGTVFVANAMNYPDALAAGAAAGAKGGPVLLVPASGALPASVQQALGYLHPTNIVIVGSSAVVGNDVQAALGAYGHVTRQSGSDRYGTSSQVATSNFSAGVANAYVVMGTDWPDALSGSALAASKQGSGPMLLVAQNSIPATVAAALTTLKPQKIYVLGSTAVVSAAVQSGLARYTASGKPISVGRLSGPDRYATSVAIAKQLDAINGATPVPAYFASGTTFPDALVGAPVSALTSSPLLLVPPTGAVPASVSAEVTALHAPSLVIMGGTGAVSLAVQRSLSSLVG